VYTSTRVEDEPFVSSLYNVEKQNKVSTSSADPPLIAVCGPTASGKSHLALEIALNFHGEIVNCDSLQVYRGFDLGTAKTPESDRLGIRHHLIDLHDPCDVFTAGEFARQARRVIQDITQRGNRPVLAGGTGFYLRSLIHGLSPGPERDASLRDRLSTRERRRPGSLHRLLRRFDPTTAARIHLNDVPKTMRALEICLLSHAPASMVQAREREALTGYRVLKIGLFPPRDELYRHIDLRTERMFGDGLVAEVETLLARGVPATAKPFESLGYRQALQVVRGDINVAQAIFDTALRTRQYAKRQLTWFRREPDLEVFNGFGDDPKVIAEVLERVREFEG
jgi:tRNA dimethylallyltransferase